MSIRNCYKQNASSSNEENDVTKELRAAFAFFDQNSNGLIEKEELRAVMESLGYRVSDRELRETINEVDEDGDGKIDFNEFVRMMNNATKFARWKGEELQAAFKVYCLTNRG